MMWMWTETRAWRELNFTQEVQQRGLNFLDVAATLVEDDGKPHTINILWELLQSEACRKGRKQR